MAATWKQRLKLEWRTQRSRYLDSFIFIHINKNGGSSIERALNLRFEHLTAEEKRWELGVDRWSSRFTFAFVRNPWDRVVSQYHYRLKRQQLGLRQSPMEFEEWVCRAYLEQDPEVMNQPKFFMPQLMWIADDDRNLMVDYVARFERFAEEFQEICARIGTSASLPHVKSSERGPYTDYYTDKTRRIVAEHFSMDIDAFGYTFGE